MKTPFFPVPFDTMTANFDFAHGDPKVRSIGHADLIPIRLSHPNNCHGFKVIEGNKQFVFFTDHELGHKHVKALDTDAYMDFCRDADFLFQDAQYTGHEYVKTRGWGHSSITDAVAFGIKANVKKLGLFHHDPDRSDDELADLEATLREQLRSVDTKMDCFAVREGMTLQL